jgi:hypothetical protein
MELRAVRNAVESGISGLFSQIRSVFGISEPIYLSSLTICQLGYLPDGVT